MDIRNVTEFRNFVNLNGLTNSHSTLQGLVGCVMDYERACGCWSQEKKQKIYNNCKILYAQAVSIATSQMRNAFLSKAPDRRLNFYQDGQLLASLR